MSAAGRAARSAFAGFVFGCMALSASHGARAGEVFQLEVKVAQASTDLTTKEPFIFVKVTEDSKRLMADISQKNIGRTLELRVDGKSVAKPIVREPLLDGVFHITGHYTMGEAKDIAKKLSTGTKIEVEVLD